MPPLPNPPVFSAGPAFRKFFLYKLLNACRANLYRPEISSLVNEVGCEPVLSLDSSPLPLHSQILSILFLIPTSLDTLLLLSSPSCFSLSPPVSLCPLLFLSPPSSLPLSLLFLPALSCFPLLSQLRRNTLIRTATQAYMASNPTGGMYRSKIPLGLPTSKKATAGYQCDVFVSLPRPSYIVLNCVSFLFLVLISPSSSSQHERSHSRMRFRRH